MLTNESITALHRLATSADEHREAAAAVATAVQQARAAGASWAQVAGMLGCSKQAAAARFTPKPTQAATGLRLF